MMNSNTEPEESILVARLSSLGDIIQALPAFAALRLSKPNARIFWLAEPIGAKLLANVKGLDGIISIQLKNRGVLKNVSRLMLEWRGRFDLIIDFQGLLKSALLCRLLGRNVLGFHKSNLRESLAAVFYRKKALPFPECDHVIKKNLHLLTAINIDSNNCSYPLDPLPSSAQLQSFFQKNDLRPGKWLAVNCGGGWPSKILSSDRLAKIIIDLMKDYRPVLFWGNQKEKEVCMGISGRTGCIMAPELNFSDLIHFLRAASLLVSADTLALHLADAVGTPSVAYFGPTSPRRNGSRLERSVAVFRKTSCGFCYRRTCDTMNCMNAFADEEISAAVRRIHEQVH